MTSIGVGVVAGLFTYTGQDAGTMGMVMTGLTTLVAGGTMYFLVDLVEGLLTKNTVALQEAYSKSMTEIRKTFMQALKETGDNITDDIKENHQEIIALEKLLNTNLEAYQHTQAYTKEMLDFLKEAINKMNSIPENYELLSQKVEEIHMQNGHFIEKIDTSIKVAQETQQNVMKEMGQVATNIQSSMNGMVQNLENALSEQMIKAEQHSMKLKEKLVEANEKLANNLEENYTVLSQKVEEVHTQNGHFIESITELMTNLKVSTDLSIKMTQESRQHVMEEVQKVIAGVQDNIKDMVQRLEKAMAVQMMQDKKSNTELKEHLGTVNEDLVRSLRDNYNDLIKEQKKQKESMEGQVQELLQEQAKTQENILMLTKQAMEQVKIIDAMQQELLEVNAKDLEVLGKLLNV